VIVISGHDWAGTRRLALDEGAAAFLGKPFSTHELLGLVRDILGEPPAGTPRVPPPPGCSAPRRSAPGLPG
jgi:DNA-binding response OmpR family regulator